MMNNIVWTLWIVLASNGRYGEITYVYARDEQHARERAKNWIDVHSHLPKVQLREFPDGFQIARGRLPGAISVGNEE